MATLLGRTTAGTTGDFSGSGATAAWKFTASATGTLAVIKAQTKVANATATPIRLGIYSDGGSAPATGGLLDVADVDSLAAARGTGVFQATMTGGVTINSGTAYWLAWYAAGENFNFQGDSSGSYREFGGANFPNTSWSGAGTSTVNNIIWGEDSGAGGGVTIRLLGVTGVGT